MAIEHMALRTMTEYLVDKKILPPKYRNNVASPRKINEVLAILHPDICIYPSTTGNKLHHFVEWCIRLGLQILEKKPEDERFIKSMEHGAKAKQKKKRKTKEEKLAARKSRIEKRNSMLSETQYAAFIEKAKQHLDYDYINSPDFLKSQAWANLRYTKLLASDNRCACCGRSVKDGVTLNVDHIKPRRLFPELALESSNLQVLCSECNKGKASASTTRF